MTSPDNDDLVTGEALIRELVDASDPVEQRRALRGVWDSGDRLIEAGRNEDALRLFDELLAWQLDRNREEAPDESAEEEIAYTMLNRADALQNLDRLAEAVAQWDDVIRRYGRTHESASAILQDRVARALFWKGLNLLWLERWLESLAAFEELIAREQALPDRSRRLLMYARSNRGMALEGLGDEAGAAAAYAEAISALRPDEDQEVLRVGQETMIDQGRILARLGRTEEALDIFDALISLPEPAAPRAVADAYLRKAYWLAHGREFEAAIAVADAAVQRFASSDDPAIRWYVASCLEEKIYALKRLGRKDAAAFVADQLVERFGADLDPGIEKIVAPHAHRGRRGRSRIGFSDLG